MADVPTGRRVRLPRRGTTFVHEATGPDGAPAVVLLHGLGATAALNWPGALEALAPHARVVALDNRGHGRGLRSPWPFRLEDCADDVVALADVLGIDRFVIAGYSMGGPIALLAARRHPSRVSGLVMCATSANFTNDDGRGPSRLGGVLAASMRLTPPAMRRHVAGSAMSYFGVDEQLPPAMRAEFRRHDPAAILEATRAVRRFDARPWLGELRAPAASVVTDRDRLVPRSRQLELARGVDAVLVPVDGDHDVALRTPGRFLPALVAAFRTVAAHAGSTA
ncbi:MAG: alpha/beta hydrolase [Ilumatobacteraceae bacterium]